MENEAMKLDASYWNGQICLDNSEWLAENIKGIDQSVKEMLQLIEHDLDSKVDDDNNNPKQPELIACIKEISHRHHLLVDHYNKVTGELSKSANKTKNNEKTTFDSKLTPPFLTPMNNKLRTHDAEGSDLSLSSGGGISDITPNEGSQSSFSSDSDSEAYYTIRNEHSGSFSSRKTMRHEIIKMAAEISEYEKELNISNEKLMSAEEEIAKFKNELLNNEAEIMSARNQIKLQEAEIEKENERSLNLQRKIVDLETELESEKKKYTVDLSGRDRQIQKLNTEFQDASGNFALEKWQLESTVSKLSERLNELQTQFDSLAAENKKRESEKAEMERKQEALRITWEDDIESVKNEISEKNELVGSLNENLDGFKLKYDLLMVEKDGVIAKVQTLGAEISCRDDMIRHLEHNLKELHSENKRLSQLCESGNELTCELKSRIEELEREAGMKAIVISDMAEGKREAIRQLCFSIEHFRCAYEEVRDACVARKGPTGVRW
ncbi:hypothetical protein PHJA_000806800 [Phtheirospermum japonicum]|uniref:NAB domain-containing protein n=1 Tax=Phtheirospermum japonicum TaxID=374723 RepID=A0A830BGB9_9LAMI|nr:hypothetical protein PHJA_000806800 [Phtheirospermum japonicum]